MMFSLVRKLSMQQLMRNQLACSLAPVSVSNRAISTSDGVQNSETMTLSLKNYGKSVHKIGGLPHELVNEQKLKKTKRTLSTLENHSVPIAARVTVSKDESRDFMAIFPDVVRDLTEAAGKYNCRDAANWFAKMLQYNVPRGKKNRGLLTVLTYKNLVKKEELTAENIKLAQLLGWCVEMLQSFFIVADDIMDDSSTRRGQVCWHKVDGVGMEAINDVLMMQSGICIILKKYFSHLDCYKDLLELFNEITFITVCGQAMDMLNSNKNVLDFNMEKYNSIVTNKTAYYTFYLPFALAMRLAGYNDAEAYRQSKTILLEMGQFFQVQDDFLDCFGNPDVTGKVGTDIQDNKCSWLAVVCMQRANEEQKALMAECYGQTDAEKVLRVKKLYEELGIPNTYAIYEEESYNMIKTHIQQTSRGVPHEIFLQILNKIYQRDS